MPLQNRVTPTGDILAVADRGTLMGNRGILHDETQRLGRSRWKHWNWVTCVLRFKGRHRPVMSPRRYTELFFLDEAVALAAGHRPCCECRREDYRSWQAAFARGNALAERPGAKRMDAILQPARIARGSRRQIRFTANLEDLPPGTFVLSPDGCEAAALWHAGRLHPYSPAGYGRPVRPADTAARVVVLTPRPSVAALAAGYRAGIHASAAPD